MEEIATAKSQLERHVAGVLQSITSIQTSVNKVTHDLQEKENNAIREWEGLHEKLKEEERRSKTELLVLQENIRKQEEQFYARKAAAEQVATATQNIIKLNVGGTEYTTTKHTLLKEHDTFFHAMLHSGAWQPDHGGAYFVDRNPCFFQSILDYLRDGKLYLSVDRLEEDEQKRFFADVQYYQIDSLLALLAFPSPVTPIACELINTVAGNGLRSFGGDGHQATMAAFNIPSGICISDDGLLYIADRYNHRVRQLDLNTGLIHTVVGDGSPGYAGDGGIATTAKITGPVRVAAGAGKLFIADCNCECVRVVDLQTKIIETVAGTGSAGYSGDGKEAKLGQLDGPRGLAVQDNILYIADSNNHCVRVVSLHTGIIDTFVGTGNAGFSGDGGYAGECQLNRPRDLAISDHFLFISDCNNFRIRVVDLRTKIVTTLIGTGSRSYSGDGGKLLKAELKWPLGLAVHGNKLFIADNCAHCIRMADLERGSIATLCGNGEQGCTGDGAAPVDAQIANPIGLGVWKGKLYISGPHCIRVVS